MFDFAESTKDMTAAEILNYYRNLYYAEPQVTERGIVANAINDYLQKAAPRAEWISIEERVPDGNGVFIVSLKERGYENLVYFDVRSYADGEWRNLPDKFTVSHWMPLPEPPKGD